MSTTRTEDRILSSAMILFVEQGYYATSVPDIVKHSKTSTGAVYHHFGSKAELARQLHQQVVAEFMESAEIQVLAVSGAQNRLRAFVQLLFTLADTDPHRVSYLLHARPRVVVDGEFTICSREGFQVTLQIIETGIQNREIRAADPRVLCGLVSGTIVRMIQLRLDDVVPAPLYAFVDEATDAIWPGLSA